MENMILHAATVFMGFFAIMNPIANAPIFLGLTSDFDARTTRAVALRSLLLAFIIVAVFSVIGKLIFAMFGFTLHAFRITGGLLVFLVGFYMQQGNLSSVQHPSDEHKEQSREAALGVAVLCLITYFLFVFGEKIVTYLGASALGVITRMMGLIIAVIGTQMVLEGLHGAFKHVGWGPSLVAHQTSLSSDHGRYPRSLRPMQRVRIRPSGGGSIVLSPCHQATASRVIGKKLVCHQGMA